MVLVVADGLGGLPHPKTGKTELETARTPNLDLLAADSLTGLSVPVGPGITPGSGPGHLALFGYDPISSNIGRGALSALGIGLPLSAQDVAIRLNFCTLDAGGNVADRRAGRIETELNRKLVAELSDIRLDGAAVEMATESQHRAVLVLRGEGLSPLVQETDPQKTGVPPLPPDPLAPDLLASYHVDETFPTYGPNTPMGGLPYGLGLSISSSAFNQLLKAEIESGLLRATLTEIDLGFGPIPITAGFLSLLVPQFGSIPPATPLTIEIEPALAPVVTGNDGPFGELAEMLIPHLLIRIPNPNSATPYVEFVIEVTVGLEIDFVGGELQFLLGTLDAGYILVAITENSINASEAQLTNVVLTVAPLLFPSLADSLGTFPLPDFLGLQLPLVEIGKLGEYMSLFVNLTPAP